MNKRLNVGYIMQADAVDMSTVSGPQLHVQAVIQGLQKRDHHVRLVAIQNGTPLWTDDLQTWQPGVFRSSESKPFRLIERGVRGIQGRLRLPYFRFFDSYRFSEVCSSACAGYDLLYERDGTISYGGLLAARRLGIPLILEVNGDLVEEWHQLGLRWSWTQRNLVYLITRQLYRSASHIVTVGETLRRRLIQRWGLKPANISVVTNGVDVEAIATRDSDASPKGASGDANGLRPTIIFIGGFQPWHGIDHIINGFHRLVSLRSDAQLILVGDGPVWLDARCQVDRLNLQQHVLFTGRTEHRDVIKLLHKADVAVIYHRGNAAQIVETPLKLFEYMAAGKAIVAPAVPNMHRILSNEVNALLIPPDDPDALASAFCRLLDQPALRQSLGTAAQSDAFRLHSWNRAVLELENVFYRQITAYGTDTHTR